MNLIHVSFGGPTLMIIDGKNRRWKFEDHHCCGPIVLGRDDDPLETQPPENSAFWDAVSLWYAQGKRTNKLKTGDVFCVWTKPSIQRMRHIGSCNYELVTDDDNKNTARAEQ